MRVCRLLSTFAGVLLLAGSAGAAEWRVPGDFPTIQEAIDSPSVKAGDTIVVEAGQHAGATVTKAVAILASGHVDIVDGPVTGAFGKAGFYFPGDGQGSGATITGFTFTDIPLPVFSRGADDVAVTQNTMSLFLQGVTNWGYGSWGNRWQVADNTLTNPRTSCGGGIGVMVGDFEGGTLSGNLIARNTIGGSVRVPADDCGGYNAPGILLYADFRLGASGATIQGNIVTKNRVAIRNTTPRRGGDLVTFSAIELTDTRDNWSIQPPALVSNVVNYNDLRGTRAPFSFTPDELPAANPIGSNYVYPGDYILNRQPRATTALASRGPSPIR